MHLAQSIRSVGQIFQSNRIDIPGKAGVYAFWWIGDREILLSSNRNIVLKGPGGRPVDVTYEDWWPEDLIYPCLYIGKSTDIKKRFSQHIKRKSFGRLHPKPENNCKGRPATTSCQLRFGIEHIFPEDTNPLSLIFNSVGFSYRTDFEANAIAERFFEEDKLIGLWRPWFNIDSER